MNTSPQHYKTCFSLGVAHPNYSLSLSITVWAVFNIHDGKINCLYNKTLIISDTLSSFISNSCKPLYLIFVVPCIMIFSGEISPTRCNNCVFYSQWLLLYMFRVTISPIIRSTMLYMATGELAHLGCY